MEYLVKAIALAFGISFFKFSVIRMIVYSILGFLFLMLSLFLSFRGDELITQVSFYEFLFYSLIVFASYSSSKIETSSGSPVWKSFLHDFLWVGRPLFYSCLFVVAFAYFIDFDRSERNDFMRSELFVWISVLADEIILFLLALPVLFRNIKVRWFDGGVNHRDSDACPDQG